MFDTEGLIELPNGWHWESLESLAGPSGVACDGDWVESKDQNADGEVRLIQLADIGDGYFRNKSERFLTRDTALRLNCTFLNLATFLLHACPTHSGVRASSRTSVNQR